MRLSRAMKCIVSSPVFTKLSEVESNGHRPKAGRRRHIRSLCLRYNTGPEMRSTKYEVQSTKYEVQESGGQHPPFFSSYFVLRT
jgi:hypothetical protein